MLSVAAGAVLTFEGPMSQKDIKGRHHKRRRLNSGPNEELSTITCSERRRFFWDCRALTAAIRLDCRPLTLGTQRQPSRKPLLGYQSSTEFNSETLRRFGIVAPRNSRVFPSYLEMALQICLCLRCRGCVCAMNCMAVTNPSNRPQRPLALFVMLACYYLYLVAQAAAVSVHCNPTTATLGHAATHEHRVDTPR